MENNQSQARQSVSDSVHLPSLSLQKRPLNRPFKHPGSVAVLCRQHGVEGALRRLDRWMASGKMAHVPGAVAEYKW